jgi:hypothetical protein
MKNLFIAGRTYKLSVRAWDGLIAVKGADLVGGIVLPEGTSLDDKNLKEKVVAAIAENRDNETEMPT